MIAWQGTSPKERGGITLKGKIIAAGIFTGLIIAIGLFLMVIIHDEVVWLNTSQVVDEFEDQGLVLSLNKTYIASEYSAGAVLPTIYDIADSDYNMFIYEFKDIDERDEWIKQSSYMGTSFVADHLLAPYETKNILIYLVYPADDVFDHLEEIHEMGERIDKIVLYNFNHATKYRYEGSSEHWRGDMILEFYCNNIEDGENHYTEGEAILTYEIEFLGENHQDIGPMSVEKTFKSGAVEKVESYDISLLDDDGWYRSVSNVRSSSGSNMDQYEITFTWQGQKETLVLENKGPLPFK